MPHTDHAAFDGATPFYLKCAGATCEPRHEWYRNCFMPVEKERGLDDQEDQLFAGLFRTKLKVGSSVTFVATTETGAALDGAVARAESADREAKLLIRSEPCASPRPQRAAGAHAGRVGYSVLAKLR